MPPVLRWAQGRIRIPADIPEAARWVLSEYLEDSELAEHAWGYDDSFMRALRRMRPIRRYASGFIVTDADEFAIVRNMLDLELLATEPQCEDYAENPPEDVADGVCYECPWCQAIILRDRFDYWLDRAGFRKNAYIYDIDYDVEAEWRKVIGDQMSLMGGVR